MQLYQELSQDIAFLTIRSARYYDSKRLKRLTFKERDKVYLLHHNLKTKRLSKKLDYIKLRPFKVKEVIGTVNYRLKLL